MSVFIGVNNTLDKAEIAGHHVLEVISGENHPDVQLDVLSCMSVLVELFRRLAVGNEEEGPEGHLSLGDKVCLGHGAALVLGDELIDLVVIPLLDLIRLPGPYRLGLVTRLQIPSGFLNFLGFRLLLFLPFRFFLCNFILIRPLYSLGA